MKRPYSSHRDSGVEWLGQVPDHWTVRSLHQICQFTYGDSLPSDARRPGAVPVFGSNGLVDYHDVPNTCAPVVVIGRKGSFGTVHFHETAVFVIDTAFFVDKRYTRCDLRWLYYALPCTQLTDVSIDSAVPGLSISHVYAKNLALPPLDEQRVIVEYLARETARIDSLVAKKRLLVERLDEYRTALITRTVTRGLPPKAAHAAGFDPSPRLKPSGVEWLGEIPQHWKVKRLRRVVRLQAGGTITSDDIQDTGKYPVFGGNGVRGFTDRYTHDGEFVLIGRQGALCGNVHLVRGKFFASEHAVVTTPIRGEDVSWLGRVLDAMKLNQYSTVVAQPGLAVDRINILSVPYPPVGEQRAIAAFLDHKTNRITGLSRKVVIAIELLHEYRTALITAAVTGKIDVRDSMANGAKATRARWHRRI